MTEVTHDGTPDRDTKNVTQPLDGSTLPRDYDTDLDNPYLGHQGKLDADFDAGIIDRQTYREITVLNANLAAPDAQISADHPESITDNSASEENTKVSADTQTQADVLPSETESPTTRLSRRDAIIGGLGFASAVVFGKLDYDDTQKSTRHTTTNTSTVPNNNTVGVSTSSPKATPKQSAQPPIEKPSPSENAPDQPTESIAGKDARAGQAYFETADVQDFNRLSIKARMQAVNYRGYNMLYVDNNEANLFTSLNKRDPNQTGQPFAGDKELYDFDAYFMATNGVKNDINHVTAQDLLDQYVLNEALVWGQLKDPKDTSSNELDHDKADKMMSALYYNPNGTDAKALANQIDGTKDAKFFNSNDRLIPISMSKENYEHDFGAGYGWLEYKAINYRDDNGEHYVILTPVTEKFEGPTPTDKTEVKTVKVTRWLAVRQGDGRVDITGHLN